MFSNNAVAFAQLTNNTKINGGRMSRVLTCDNWVSLRFCDASCRHLLLAALFYLFIIYLWSVSDDLILHAKRRLLRNDKRAASISE